METPIMNKVIHQVKPFQPPKVTLEEAEQYCGVTGLRDLRLKHPYALKCVFPDWNDTHTHFQWMVYKGDLEHLKGEVRKVMAGPVVVKSVPEQVYTFLDIATKLGKTRSSVRMLKFHHPDLFVAAPRPADKSGKDLYFKEQTIANIQAYLKTSPTRQHRLAMARAAKKEKVLQPQAPQKIYFESKDNNLDIAVLLIQIGFADAGVWFI